MLTEYKDDVALLADYHRLSESSRKKVTAYVRAHVRFERAMEDFMKAENAVRREEIIMERLSRERQREKRVAEGLPTSGEKPHCDFCGRGADEVGRIIAGPGVYICNECVRVCEEVLEDVKNNS